MGGVVAMSIVAMVFTLSTAARAADPATQPTRMKLWETTPGIVAGDDADANPTEPTIDAYLPAPGKATQAAVVILPGGGYTHLSTVREGSEVAAMFVSHNITAFVVRYRLSPRYHYPTPVLDAQRALRIVRARAAEYHINPARIGIMGFSAGGHLASTVSTQFDAGQPDAPDPIDRVSSRPDFSILLYPVITFTDETAVHRGSRTALVGNDQTLWEKLSSEKHVTHDTPPTCLVQASDDRTVPVANSIMYYQALRKNNVIAELHIFQAGGHGFGLAANNEELRVWPEIVVGWMKANKWI
jgi:acetyl esterase/lipase